jgi:lactate dehydrogenase-like 2-hydroxyacid dehydrogenase
MPPLLVRDRLHAPKTHSNGQDWNDVDKAVLKNPACGGPDAAQMDHHGLSIFVTAQLPREVVDDLRRECDAVFAQDVADVEPVTQLATCTQPIALISVNERLDFRTIERLPPTLLAIATYSVGHEHIDLAAAKRRGIAVLNLPDVLTEAVAEVGMFLLIGAARRATESIALVRSRAWTGWTATQLNGVELWRKELGIFGMGRIGRAIAARARCFGMNIHYHNRHRLAPDLEAGARFHGDAKSMFGIVDALVLAAPSSAGTHGFLNGDRIAWLKRGAIVVNIARGNLIDDEALISALASGQVYAAGLDVFNNEPRLDPRYFDLPNVFMLPHIGSSTIETRRRMAQALIDSLRLWQSGGQPSNLLV